jgi:serine/threonine protein kinase
MSPEVLRGKPLSEKADIYSYGIVLWEILTRKEPFEDHDSYNTFVRAVCDNKERPPMPSDLHSSLKKVLDICWHEDATKRPTFAEILDMLEDAMVRSVLDDEDAQLMWRKYAKGKDRIPFSQFAKALYLTLGLGSPDEMSVPYQCLGLLLGQQSKRDTEGAYPRACP